MEPSVNKKINFNIVHIMALVVGVVFVALVIVTLINLFRNNPYGREIKIDNFSSFYGDAPQDIKDQIFNNLYDTVLQNIGEDDKIPGSGAMVRQETAVSQFDKDTNVYYGSFVVDIEEIQQSYRVQFEWSSNKNNPNLGGFSVLISCVPESLRIYENEVQCTTYLTSFLSWENDYQIEYSFGKTSAGIMKDIIGSVILDDGEDVARIDETSLEELEGNDLAYSFRINTLNKVYRIFAREDSTYGKEYIAVLIERDGKYNGFVVSDGQGIEPMKTWLLQMSKQSEIEVVIKPFSQFK